MTIKDLASVVPYHYNSVLRWVSKKPSRISYDCAVGLERVTGIKWYVWVQGYALKNKPPTNEMVKHVYEGWEPAVEWFDDSKDCMTVKELMPYAPFGPSATAEFERRMNELRTNELRTNLNSKFPYIN